MINRVLIRTRVVQILFSVYSTSDVSIQKAESDLNYSFKKSADLYYYLLLLLVALTDAFEKRIEAGKSKLLPTQEQKNPNTKLLDNLFIKQLRRNTALNEYLKERPLSWDDNETYIKRLLAVIIDSDIYNDYLWQKESSYEKDKEFWRSTFKHIICRDEDLEQLLEDECLFWNDDVEIIKSFVLKTIKRFDSRNDHEQELLPMFRDESDREFATKLLRETMLNVKQYRELIDEYAKNWESERIAFMDMIIMQTAIAELLNFPTIPVNVTLNEYIDIAKFYSTEKSASFINGILDAIVTKLKEEKKIIK